MKIDLHVHTIIGSPCSFIEIEELIERAKELSLDAVCITEHNNYKGIKVTRELSKKYNFLILRGMEVRCLDGDVIIVEKSPQYFHHQETTIWELAQIIHKNQGIIYPVHPFRHGVPSIQDNLYNNLELDAIEILNGNCQESENNQALKASNELRLFGLGGSDAHSKNMIGKYITIFNHKIKNEKDLIKAIEQKDGQAVQLF
ncbi:MAG: PHP domain-containing protein [bacterium]|nr:PHP domain-containing protein [bacterium]